MPALTDVDVTLEIQQATPPLNFGTLAVFVKDTASSVVRYTAVDDVIDKETSEPVQDLARGYFNQDQHASDLVVIKYADIAKALDTYFSEDFEFATVLGDDEKGADDTLALSNYVEGQDNKFAVVGVNAPASVTPEYDVSATLAPLATLSGNKRTIAFIAGKDAGKTAYAVGALIGSCGNRTVGSITWKFKTLNGVDAVNFNKGQVDLIHKAGAFTYVTKSGIDQTSDGITLGGEFVDAIHGDDWIKSQIISRLQNLLSTSAKIAYDDMGIAQLKGVITDVLIEATTNGIILVDPETKAGAYTVDAVSRADTSAEDIAKRQYNGLSYEYQRDGAIHSVVVHGKVIL